MKYFIGFVVGVIGMGTLWVCIETNFHQLPKGYELRGVLYVRDCQCGGEIHGYDDKNLGQESKNESCMDCGYSKRIELSN